MAGRDSNEIKKNADDLVTSIEKSIAGTVILFNPSDDVLENISSYVGQVARLYVIDNSTVYNDRLIGCLKSIDRINYTRNNGNKGIAYALNVGSSLALDDGYSFLLTMDQDTNLSTDFVNRLSEGLTANSNEIGIIAPRYLAEKGKSERRFENVLFTMTSGNILNLQVFKKIGPFLNELFIDHVDHEYCLRINKAGYKVIQDNEVTIEHRPGSVSGRKYLPAKLKFSSHSPVRLYYFCRNGFYVSKLYGKDFPSFSRTFLILLLKEILKTPFENSIILRMTMIWKGYTDYKRNRFGSFTE